MTSLPFGLFLPDEKVQAVEIDLTALGLFLSDENIHRHSVEIPFGTDFVFEAAFIWFFYILWQVCKEQERRNACLMQLHTIFNLYILTFD